MSETFKGYYRIYCPRCNTPDPKQKHGLLPWFKKVVLRQRQFVCAQCGHEFWRQRRQIGLSLFGASSESTPPMYLPAQGYETQGGDPHARPVAQMALKLLSINLETAKQQRRTEQLIGNAVTFLNEKETLFLAQQQDIATTQKRMADIVDNLADAIEKATGERLPPFSIISNPETPPKPQAKQDQDRSVS